MRKNNSHKIFKLCRCRLVICLILTVFAILAGFTEARAQLNFTQSKKKLIKKNDSLTVTITEEGFNSANLTVTCEEKILECLKGQNEVIVKLKDDIYAKETRTKNVELKYKKGSEEISGRAVIEIPAQLAGEPQIEIKKGENLVKDKVDLIAGQELSVTGSYKINDDETPRTDLYFQRDSGEIVKNLTDLIKKVGSYTIKIMPNGNPESSELAEFKINVLPAVKTIKIKDSSLTMYEGDSRKIEIEAFDEGGTPIPLDRIVCEKTSDPKIDTSALAVKRGSEGFVLTSAFLKTQEEVGNQAKKISPGKIDIICKVKNGATFEEKIEAQLAVSIEERRGYMTIDRLNETSTLLPGGSLNFLASVYGLNGNPEKAGIKFSLADPSDEKWVSLTEQGSKVTVNWVDLSRSKDDIRPRYVKIRVIGTGDKNLVVENSFTVGFASVTKFAPLKVKLNVMDDRTAKDLYGAVTVKDYHVLMVRLFNDLKDKETNKLTGESILAYSSSIEVAVGIEKRYDEGLETGNYGTVISADQMKKIEKDRNSRLYDSLKKNFTELDSYYEERIKGFNSLVNKYLDLEKNANRLEREAEMQTAKIEDAELARRIANKAYLDVLEANNEIRNLYQAMILPTPQITATNVAVNDGKWYPASRQDLIQISNQETYLSAQDEDSTVSLQDNEPNCQDTISYRPFTFEMMVNTVDRRDGRTLRSRAFKLLDFIASGSSFVTAIAVPAKSSDLPLGIEKFGNTFIPGMDRLFPSLKEQNRQNIVSQAMKPIEEIPFGADVTRVVFIPKKSINGLIRGHKARINQICPFYFKIKVAVISKGGEVTLTGQSPR